MLYLFIFNFRVEFEKRKIFQVEKEVFQVFVELCSVAQKKKNNNPGFFFFFFGTTTNILVVFSS